MKGILIGAVGVAMAALSCTGSGMAGGGISGGGSGGLTSGASGLSSSCNGDFGATAAASKVEAFLGASATFVNTANELANTLTQTCLQMGNDLGIPAAEMQPSGDVPPQRAACERVATQIREDMAAMRRTSAGVRVDIVSSPPRCEVSMNAYADCAGRCDASVQPGSAQMQCEGGEVRGTCSGQCTGHCYVDVHGACNGTCEGTCDGTCATRGANGACNGRCSGTCNGTCQMGATASCSGQCSGGCSVAMTEPRCTGHVDPPRMSAECRASCDAELNAHAECHPGEAKVTISGGVSGEAQARAERLRTAIGHGFGVIEMTHHKLELLARSTQGLIDTGSQLPNALGELGAGALNATRCVGEQATALPRASASVSVSVQVSASVSGSAG